MKILYTILILLFSTPLWAATYYLRADGTAANKAAATGCSAASTAMSIATHNSETFSAGDECHLCDDGGTYRATLIPPSSGSSDNVITYQAASGDPRTRRKSSSGIGVF